MLCERKKINVTVYMSSFVQACKGGNFEKRERE